MNLHGDPVSVCGCVRCRTVYDEMMHHAPSATEKDMFQKRVQELEPLIRYCKYNVGRQGGGGGENLEEDSHTLMEIGRSAGGGDAMLRGKLEKSLAETHLKQVGGSLGWHCCACSASTHGTQAAAHRHVL